MSFDPKAYLASKAAAAAPTSTFDPKAYLASKAPTVGAAETWLNRAVNAIPFAKPLTDANTAYVMQIAKALGAGEPGVKLSPEQRAQLQAMGEALPAEDAIPGVLESYRGARDTREARTAAGSAQNPVAAALGTGTGIGLSIAAPLPKATVGAGRTGRVLSNALTGAGYGAATGLTEGKADLTRGEMGQALLDTATGGLLGGGIGGLAGGVTELARPLLQKALRGLAINRGRKVIQGGSDIAAATRKPLSDEAVEEALKSGAIRPLSTTENTYRRLDALSEQEERALGEIVAALEAKGVKGPEARKLADQIFERYAQEWPVAPASKAVPQRFFDEAANIEAVAQGRSNLGLRQAERLKSNLQNAARYERLNASPTEEATQEIASIVRQANEDAINQAAAAAGKGSEVAGLAEKFVPTKQRVGRLLEARTAAERGASKASQRQTLGLQDYLAAAATGNPAAAFPVMIANNMARNRLPSTLASGAFALGEGLNVGGLPGRAAEQLFSREALQRLPQLRQPVPAFAMDEEQRRRMAIAEALRRAGEVTSSR